MMSWLRIFGRIATVMALYLLVGLGVTFWTRSALLAAIASSLTAFVLVLVRRKRRTDSLLIKTPVSLEATTSRFWATALGAVLAAFIFGQIAAALLYEQLGSPNFDGQTDVIAQSPWLFVVTSLIAAPIGEEALMRGTIFDALREKWPVWASMLASAGIFAVLHANIVQIAVALPLGLVLALVYEQLGGRLWPVMVLHFLFNLMAMTIPGEVLGLMMSPLALSLWAGIFTMLLAMLYPKNVSLDYGRDHDSTASPLR